MDHAKVRPVYFAEGVTTSSVARVINPGAYRAGPRLQCLGGCGNERLEIGWRQPLMGRRLLLPKAVLHPRWVAGLARQPLGIRHPRAAVDAGMRRARSYGVTPMIAPTSARITGVDPPSGCVVEPLF